MLSMSVMGQGTIRRNNRTNISNVSKQTTKNNATLNRDKRTSIPKKERCQTCGKYIDECYFEGIHPDFYDVMFSCNVPTAQLYIDGSNVGSIRGVQRLCEGNHHIRIVAKGYKEQTHQLTVNQNERFFHYDLESDKIYFKYCNRKINVDDLIYLFRRNVSSYVYNHEYYCNVAWGDKENAAMSKAVEEIVPLMQKGQLYMDCDGTLYDRSGTIQSIPHSAYLKEIARYLFELFKEMPNSSFDD